MPSPEPTNEPVDPALIAYLQEFARISSEIWASFPGEPSVVPQNDVQRVDRLDARLEAMKVPPPATEMHRAFQVVSANILLWHNQRAGAQMFPAQAQDYLEAADVTGNETRTWYYAEYLPARNALLEGLGLSAGSVGFTE